MPRLSANDAQKGGSAISYAKRYLAGAVLNLSFTDEDDDGEAAGTATVTSKQAARLIELLDQVDPKSGDRERFWKWLGVNAAAAVPLAKFEVAEQALGRIIAKQEGGAD